MATLITPNYSNPIRLDHATLGTKSFIEKRAVVIELQEAKKYESKSYLWQVASTTSIVAFFVLSGSLFVATAVYAFEFLPIALVSIPISERIAFWIHDYCLFYKNSTQTLGQTYRGIHSHREKLTQNTVDIERLMIRHGLPLSGDVKRFIPILARYEYSLEQVDLLAEDSELNQTLSLDPENACVKARMQFEAHSLRVQSLLAKVKAAFYRFVILNPEFDGEFADLCKIVSTRKDDEHFLSFKGPNQGGMTFAQVGYLPHDEIARRITAAYISIKTA